jgi:UDP-glucose 4-epimerase
MAILITGGAGYIGSSIANTLIDNAQRVVVIDDLSVGRREFIPRADLYIGDIGTLRRNPDIGTVIHCAAKIVVPDSVREPLLYYDNNVAKTVTLLRVLSEARIGRFIFSSTAAMYDVHDGGAASESAVVRPLSPYSRSKRMVEQILTDYCAISGISRAAQWASRFASDARAGHAGQRDATA